MELYATLHEFGLTKGESDIYEILHKIGETKVGPIIKHAHISSSNVHEALEKLAHKGLVTYIKKNNIKNYRAVPAENLIILLEEEKRHLIEKEEKLHKTITELRTIAENLESEQEVEFFIGLQGIRSCYKKLLAGENKEGEYVFFFGKDEATGDKVQEFFGKLDKENTYDKLIIRAISAPNHKKKFEERGVNFNILYTDEPIPTNLNFYENKTIITSWSGIPTAILITSKEITGVFRQYFDELWTKLSQ